MKKREIIFYILSVIGVTGLLYVTGIGCPIVKLTGIPCFGCGMTRAVLCLVKADFAGAWHFHPLVYLLPFCIMAVLLVKKMPERLVKVIVAVVVGAFILTYLIRLFHPADTIVKWRIENGILYKVIRKIIHF